MSTQTSSIFQAFQDYLNAEQDLREEIRLVVRDLEHTAREILAVIQGIHQENGVQNISVVCQQARKLLETARCQYEELRKKVPKDQYYRFHDHWRFTNQRFVFLSAMIVYLETEQLITREELSLMLGVNIGAGEGFHMDLDDYLMGILSLSSELARFTVNSVTAGDYARPLRIAKFMNELNSGFRLLNLKNDGLRKKYDALKYDIKKVEEVVYDLSIRGLKPKGEIQVGMEVSEGKD